MRACPDPQCGLLEDDLHKCGRSSTCAVKLGSELKEVRSNGKDVVLDCERCDDRRVVTAGVLAQGKQFSSLNCQMGLDEDCLCKASIPRAPKASRTNPKADAVGAGDEASGD